MGSVGRTHRMLRGLFKDERRGLAGRWRIVFVLLAGISFIAYGQAGRPRGLVTQEPFAQCEQSREGVKAFGREHPGPGVDDQIQWIEQSCGSLSYRPVPEVTPQPPIDSPGCRAEPIPRLSPTTDVAAAPDRRVPFFARRTGALPHDGSPTVGGVELPRGSRCGPYWATDAPFQEAPAVASKLAARFEHTGLWPVLWESWEDPDLYMDDWQPPRAVRPPSAGAILRAVWWEERPFPGLAQASTGAAAGSTPFDPFGTHARSVPPDRRPPDGWVLLLVPCHRPADVLSIMAMETTEFMSDDAQSVVLRSWEERFDAILTEVNPGLIGVAVGTPPRTREQALRLAAEHGAFAPENGNIGAPAWQRDIARQLLTGRTAQNEQSPRWWTFDWPD